MDASVDVKNYSISRDEKTAAFASRDEKGVSHVWIAPTDHRSSPRMFASTENEDSPWLLPDGRVLYRVTRQGKNYLYERKVEGGEAKPAIEQPILQFFSASPDGKWVVVAVSEARDPEHPYRISAYPLAGGKEVALCRMICTADWNTSGSGMHFGFFEAKSADYFLPIEKGVGLPQVGPDGMAGSEDAKKLAKAERAAENTVDSAVSVDLYSFSRKTVRRNLYRVPLE